ncbi:MAG: helix-turn-helix domain-containing protein [Coprococcus eutactus]|jgi:transcriptional regulator with XRE-family HTH domain
MNRKNEYFANKFTKLLEQWKKDNKKSQADFAELTHIHPNNISRYKKGDVFPSDSVLTTIAKTLNVSTDCFYPSGDERFFYDDDLKFKQTMDAYNKKVSIIKSYGISNDFYCWLADSTNGFEKFPFELDRKWMEIPDFPVTPQEVLFGEPEIKPWKEQIIDEAKIQDFWLKNGYYDFTPYGRESQKVRFVLLDFRGNVNWPNLAFTHKDLLYMKKLEDKTAEYMKLLNIKELVDRKKLI